MESLYGILFLLTVRMVSAGIILSPNTPFDPTDITKYKLLEKFFPENDRNAVPILQFLEKLLPINTGGPAANQTEPSDPSAISTSRRSFRFPKKIVSGAKRSEGEEGTAVFNDILTTLKEVTQKIAKAMEKKFSVPSLSPGTS